MFKSIALSALLALGTSQLPQGVDAAAALTKSISDNDTTTTYTSLDPQVRTTAHSSLTARSRHPLTLSSSTRISPGVRP
jgi:hypothetical protein